MLLCEVKCAAYSLLSKRRRSLARQVDWDRLHGVANREKPVINSIRVCVRGRVVSVSGLCNWVAWQAL